MEQLQREFAAVSPESPLLQLVLAEDTVRKLLHLRSELAPLAGEAVPAGAPDVYPMVPVSETPLPKAPVVPKMPPPKVRVPEVVPARPMLLPP